MELNTQEKIELVKNELLKHHPNCSYTITHLIWDDGTDHVECRHGDMNNMIHTASYYNNELIYASFPLYGNSAFRTKEGQMVYVMTPEQFEKYNKS